MVMPRSRSRSIRSRNWARISRSETAPVSCRNRSARVDLPWSMWAMMEKLRMGGDAATTPEANANLRHFMANIKSQMKRNRTNEKRRLRNKAVRSELKTRIKRVERAVAAGDPDATGAALRLAVKRLDMAAAKGIIHRN